MSRRMVRAVRGLQGQLGKVLSLVDEHGHLDDTSAWVRRSQEEYHRHLDGLVSASGRLPKEESTQDLSVYGVYRYTVEVNLLPSL